MSNTPASGSDRVVRGGSWGSPARAAWISYRGYFRPGCSDSFLGFRLLRVSN